MNKKRSHKHLALFAFALLLLGLGLSSFVWVRKEQRQYVLDRQLIAALAKADTKEALALVEAGANPNTWRVSTPAPSLPELIKLLLHPSPPTVNDKQTAFMMACEHRWDKSIPEDLPLLQAMLAHGANVHARTVHNYTALHYAAFSARIRTVKLLLQHKADVNAKDEWDTTPLMLVSRNQTIEVPHLLLTHGASVNAQDRSGKTALHHIVEWRCAFLLVPELLTHGADPDLADRTGATAIQDAEEWQPPDLIARLRKYSKHP